jgi:hypothetical protein
VLVRALVLALVLALVGRRSALELGQEMNRHRRKPQPSQRLPRQTTTPIAAAIGPIESQIDVSSC